MTDNDKNRMNKSSLVDTALQSNLFYELVGNDNIVVWELQNVDSVPILPTASTSLHAVSLPICILVLGWDLGWGTEQAGILSKEVLWGWRRDKCSQMRVYICKVIHGWAIRGLGVTLNQINPTTVTLVHDLPQSLCFLDCTVQLCFALLANESNFCLPEFDLEKDSRLYT